MAIPSTQEGNCCTKCGRLQVRHNMFIKLYMPLVCIKKLIFIVKNSIPCGTQQYLLLSHLDLASFCHNYALDFASCT